jgi:hypothetical protein
MILQADSWNEALELLRRREVGKLWSTWDYTPDSERPRLLKSWLEGPVAVYPAKVPNMSYPYNCLPPVHREAVIYRQIRETNPARGDRHHKWRREKLFFGVGQAETCAVCGLEDLEQLSTIHSSSACSICSVCYTVTDKANSANVNLQCSGRCLVEVDPVARHDPRVVLKFYRSGV